MWYLGKQEHCVHTSWWLSSRVGSACPHVPVAANPRCGGVAPKCGRAKVLPYTEVLLSHTKNGPWIVPWRSGYQSRADALLLGYISCRSQCCYPEVWSYQSFGSTPPFPVVTSQCVLSTTYLHSMVKMSWRTRRVPVRMKSVFWSTVIQHNVKNF